MVTVIRLARIVLLVLVTALVIPCVAGIATPHSGPAEKAVLAAVIVALLLLAAGISTLADRAESLVRSRAAHSPDPAHDATGRNAPAH